MNDEFAVEQSKRDARITLAQRIAWGDSLLAQLSDSPSYRAKCRKESRLAEQAELNRIVQQWLDSRQEQFNKNDDQ
ncbi:MAG TPA: hypothetical protein DCF63_12540 [Planctomycetaceae bacterium]|nr:hypothetical protein [Planctomycetaceae bacterium]